MKLFEGYLIIIQLSSSREVIKAVKVRSRSIKNQKCIKPTRYSSPTVAGLPQQAKHMAWVTVDFPVPFGPRITFNRGPGNTSQSSNVRKLCIRTLRTEPLRYPFFLSSPTSPFPLRYSAVKSSLSGILSYSSKTNFKTTP